MTSRQRVLNTFSKEKADRMPIDYFGNVGINDKLCKHFKTDYFGVLDALNVDFRTGSPNYLGKPLFEEKQGMSVNPIYGYYYKWIEHATGGYFDFCHFPLQDESDEKIANFPVPDPDLFDYETFAAQIKSFEDKAIYVGNGGFADVINATGRVMGMEQTLINLFTEDEATLCYINRRTDFELAQLERMIKVLDGRTDFLWIGEDLGTQIAPMISLELYRKVLRPIHQRYVDLAKSYNLPVMIHTCGYSSWAYNDFVEMGIDAVDTLQPEVVNMNPEYLIENFGGKLSFHGSISTAGPLAYGGVEDIEKQVKETCEIYRPTKAYMISPTHSIQDNSPLENVLKMYEAALKFGKY